MIDETKPANEMSDDEIFEYACLRMGHKIHEITKAKGFWHDGAARNKSEMIALMHSELSEALEAQRKCDSFDDATHVINIHSRKDDKITDESAVGVEMADCVVRILDYCHGFGINLGLCLAKKVNYNANRPYMHGKNA